MGTDVEHQTAYSGDLPFLPDTSGMRVTSKCFDLRQICGERTFEWHAALPPHRIFAGGNRLRVFKGCLGYKHRPIRGEQSNVFSSISDSMAKALSRNGTP
jgi:hypothetical protein